jgi:hypothetical protein
MKTAMQDLIEWYQKEHFVKTTFHIQLLNKFESLVEKEKEQIICSYIANRYVNAGGYPTRRDIAEDYYNQTYNN